MYCLKKYKMKINPISRIKPLTVNGCCDRVSIVAKSTTINHGKHKFIAKVCFCSNCGSVKATSNIKSMKEHNRGNKS